MCVDTPLWAVGNTTGSATDGLMIHNQALTGAKDRIEP